MDSDQDIDHRLRGDGQVWRASQQTALHSPSAYRSRAVPWIAGAATAVVVISLGIGTAMLSHRHTDQPQTGGSGSNSVRSSATSSPPGIVSGFTLGAGSYALVVSLPASDSVRVNEKSAWSKIVYTATNEALFDHSRLVRFGLARVTTKDSDSGPITNVPAWVAVYAVPVNQIPPPGGGCHGNTSSTAAISPSAEVAIYVDATTGAVSIWNQVITC